ncbi:NRAMP family divalent metal transporter [Amycolatopsis vancoresmycina]|uniref:NRAMP family divalent metal transporter n=1 Tax=Amycolatopsis vancoresmycina TaxID=208444 RepID=UPI00052777A4|nr:divalent metal cation transporter [Amycolatopsis vancoresmycina]
MSKKLLAVTLGILTAVGGFVDIGDLVESGVVGARYGMAMVWVTVLGVLGICVYADMSGRVVAVSGRPVFDLIRERLGPRMALLNLAGSFLITLLTVCAEIGGVAITVELASGVDRLVWVLPIGVLVWLVIWRVGFERMETGFGLGGLAIGVFAVAIFFLHPDWSSLGSQVAGLAPPPDEALPTYAYHAVALFASAMTPYEVFFFSSGGVEEGWQVKDLSVQRANVLLGFPLGGLLAIAVMACAATVLFPAGVDVSQVSQIVLPVTLALGTAGLVIVLIGIFAATFGAALETGLSSGYMLAQYFGWDWGKRRAPRNAARFHLTVGAGLLLAVLVVQTGIDPVGLTEISLIFSAVALPLTYLPVLIVANDREYLGKHANRRFSNIVGVGTLVIIVVAAVTAIPLMIFTGAGQ